MTADRRERFVRWLSALLDHGAAAVASIENFLRNLHVVLMSSRRGLIFLLIDWALIAYLAWGFSLGTGSYAAGFKTGYVFCLVLFGVVITVRFTVRVIRKAVHL